MLPPTPQKVRPLCIANLTAKTAEERDWFRPTVIYDVYTKVCEVEGTDDLTTDTIRDLLSELAFLEVTGSNQEHGGMGKGPTRNTVSSGNRASSSKWTRTPPRSTWTSG
jgi:cell division control protein 6